MLSDWLSGEKAENAPALGIELPAASLTEASCEFSACSECFEGLAVKLPVQQGFSR